MRFSLLICTYMRPVALSNLLDSVAAQTLYPNEILVIDGSTDNLTGQMIAQRNFKNVRYFMVPVKDRGLTRQRNYGIARTAETDVVCFLDDDVILEPDYFERLISTYSEYPDALGVGGYICNEGDWQPAKDDYKPLPAEFAFDGWKRSDGSRFVLRKKLGLDSDVPPGYAPEFSHGRSVGFLPPSGKVYEVQQLMGGVSSFKKEVFSKFSFSTYFEGYGLYEDADFTLRVSASGKLYINTAARLYHYHDAAGRPNKYNYGKMVVRNGWYVWRVKDPNPSLKAKAKWHAITLLLAGIRFANAITTSKRQESLTEAIGRFSGWLTLFFDKPKKQ